MIRILVALPFSILLAGDISAQGIYKTSSDYTNKTISYKDHSVNADLAFNSSSVKVGRGEEKLRLQKSDIYGFRNNRDQDFRFFNNANYKVVDAASFYIYSREENIVKGKAKTRETRYYFSKDADSPIMPLTIYNLKSAFPANRQFHDLLDVNFRSDRELLKYDNFHKEYKLKYIFNKAV